MRYELIIYWSKGDECFIAQVVEWSGIMAHGDTREEAARQIQLALEGALEVAAERGIKPPVAPTCHVGALAKMEARRRRINFPVELPTFFSAYSPLTTNQ